MQFLNKTQVIQTILRSYSGDFPVTIYNEFATFFGRYSDKGTAQFIGYSGAFQHLFQQRHNKGISLRIRRPLVNQTPNVPTTSCAFHHQGDHHGQNDPYVHSRNCLTAFIKQSCYDCCVYFTFPIDTTTPRSLKSGAIQAPLRHSKSTP